MRNARRKKMTLGERKKNEWNKKKDKRKTTEKKLGKKSENDNDQKDMGVENNKILSVYASKKKTQTPSMKNRIWRLHYCKYSLS